MVVAFRAHSGFVSVVVMASNARTREIPQAFNMIYLLGGKLCSAGKRFCKRIAGNTQPTICPVRPVELARRCPKPAFIEHPCCNRSIESMPSVLTNLRRRAKALHRNLRGANMAVRALASTDHPLLAHIIPMRRCNLSCTYCNEYDDFSKPVPIETMYRRLDHLASLGTTVITISGGEPLMHPDLDQIIARIRKRGMIAGMITNGYLLVADRIQRLNRAGLEHLQISIDNVNPDEVSKKSLKVLDKKLELLAQYAE